MGFTCNACKHYKEFYYFFLLFSIFDSIPQMYLRFFSFFALNAFYPQQKSAFVNVFVAFFSIFAFFPNALMNCSFLCVVLDGSLGKVKLCTCESVVHNSFFSFFVSSRDFLCNLIIIFTARVLHCNATRQRIIIINVVCCCRCV